MDSKVFNPDFTTYVVTVDEYPSLTPSKNQGYLSLALKPDLSNINVQEQPFPKMMPSVNLSKNQGYPSFESFDSLSEMLTQEQPFPKMMPSVSKEYDDGYPSLRLKGFSFGAFSNMPNLVEIVIPKSVKYIADYAFYNTKIKEVTISKECKYYEHSFPEDCKINLYND